MNDRTSEPVDILLVEDNPGDVRLTKEAFKQEHIHNTLHVTTDGVEALDFLLQRNEYADAPRPDIVLLDLNLPQMNGDEVLEKIRADPRLEYLPVIVLTSSSAEEDIVKSYQLQANAFLTKPVDPVEFIDTIKSFQQFWLSVVRLPSYEEQ
jgi:CheY-like chemotaxis protein